MREPSDAVIDRLGDDVARLEAEADAVWAVLDAAGIDVQLGVDTLADGVRMLVAVRDVAIADAEQWSGRHHAAAEVLRGLGDTISDWEDGQMTDYDPSVVRQRDEWREAAVVRGQRLDAIAAQLGEVSWGTIPEAIVAVLNERDEAIIDRDNYAAAFRAMTAALLPFISGGSDV